jgi:hypothetical protein
MLDSNKILINVDCHVTDRDKELLTLECIENLKFLGLPILVTSHIDIPESIKKSVDFYFTDYNNKLIKRNNFSQLFIYWENSHIKTSLAIPNQEFHGPAAVLGAINAFKFGEREGFEHVIRVEYDHVLTEEGKDRLKKVINLANDFGGFFVSRRGDISERWIEGGIICFKPSLYLKIYEGIDIDNFYQDWFPFLEREGVPEKYIEMAEKTLIFLIEKKNLLDNFLEIPPVDNCYFTRKNNLEWRGRVSGIFRPVSLDGVENFNLCLLAQGMQGEITCPVKMVEDGGEESDYFLNYIEGQISYVFLKIKENTKYKIIHEDPVSNEKYIYEIEKIEDLKKYGSFILK